MKLRPYQIDAIRAVRKLRSDGAKAILVVAPTGSGKTTIGGELVDVEEPVTWVAHRRELVFQARDRLVSRFGARAVGVVMAGEPPTAGARVTVGTVQSLRFALPPADGGVLLDEAHHYVSEDWQSVVGLCKPAWLFGLTATPQRGDGTPMGDLFEHLVPVASYSELIRDGYLVRTALLQPPEDLGNNLAMDPLDAWAKHAGNAQTFICCARVSIAQEMAQRFRDHGVVAATVHAETAKRERDDILGRFRSGRVRVLTYVDTMTEGVDVPEAACMMLAKNFGTVGGYIQTVGRVLRPSRDKTHALVIDLCGTTLRHGPPTKDRSYSLAGRPISGEGFPPGGGGVPTFEQSIVGVELRASGWAPTTAPVATDPVDVVARRTEFNRLRDMARQHRMRDGFAAAKYHEKFGEWPSGEWA